MSPSKRLPNLRSLRLARGLTRQQLVDAVPLSISLRTLDRWETGETRIDEDYWAALAEFFRVSVSHLLAWDEPNGNGNGDRVAA